MITAGNTSAGGGEKHVLDLSSGFIKRGHNVMVVAPIGGDVLDRASDLGCETQGVESWNPLSAKIHHALARLIHDWKPDIVHAHGPRAAYFARHQSAEVHSRLVYTIHGIHAGHGMLGAVKLAVERRDKQKVVAYIVTCRADFDQGEQMGILVPDITRIIYNGVPDPQPTTSGRFRAQMNIDSARPLVLHVGRISQPKDHPTLLAAFDRTWSMLSGAMKPVLVLVASGSSCDRAFLRRRINRLDSRSDIYLLDVQTDLAPLYTDADIFMLSSLWEARPYVLVEAMQYQCAVISTDVGGVNEVVTDGKTGILVPPKSPEQLAQALCNIIVDHDVCGRLAIAGQESIVGRFTLDEMVDRTLEVYQQALGTPVR